jgi:hypothetical protein
MYISDRRRCAWNLWERLAEMGHPMAEKVWEMLRECDAEYSESCYDRIILELERLLGATVRYIHM